MIDCPSINKQVIRGHYDFSTLFYRLLWGPHIHHGYWEHNESPRVAQVQLTERLANLAGLTGNQHLIDVGCGMGGSSIHLAKTRGCTATGVTVSPVQHRWANLSAFLQRVGHKTKFQCADAEQVALPENSADVVWSIECTEHLFDKEAFFQRSAGWLKPGGTMAICAWLAGEDPLTNIQKQQVHEVCEGFFCPSLGSASDYVRWMSDSGLAVEVVEDWTDRVARTWELCGQRVKRSGVRWVAKVFNRGQLVFLDRFETLLNAYRSGAMRYGCFIARKPAKTPG